MQPLSLLILTAATFYFAHAISSTHGPYNVFDTLKARFPLGGLTKCFVCLSIWLAVLFWFVFQWEPRIVEPIAIAGLAVILWRYTGGPNLD